MAPSCPRVIAHRGASLAAPENTIPAITAAASAGAAGVELDVQWSNSHFPILMHDATVDRTTNGTGTPASQGLGALTALEANDFSPGPGMPRWDSLPAFTGANTPRVPYGGEFMATARELDLDVILDIHATPTQIGTDKLDIYVRGYNAWHGRTVVMGSAAQVAAMHAWEPLIRYAVIEYPPTGRVFTPEYLIGIGAGAYAVPWGRVTAGLVGYMHAAGLDVFAWTSDSPAQDVPVNWLAMAAAGADALITNDPAAAVATLDCPAED